MVRVLVLMISSRNIPPYAHKAALANYWYAARHGYSFAVETYPPRATRTPFDPANEYTMAWTKPAFLRKHLPAYDLVLFIDSDAVVVDASRRVEDFWAAHDDGHAVALAARDCVTGDPRTCSGPAGDLNTGVMVWKRSRAALALLDAWVAAPWGACADLERRFPYEQGCLNRLKRQPRFAGRVRVLPTTAMNGAGPDSPWIRHFMAQSAERRDAQIARYVPRAAARRGWGWAVALLLAVALAAAALAAAALALASRRPGTARGS